MSDVETILDSYKSICAVCEEKESSCEECCCGVLIRVVEKQIPKKALDTWENDIERRRHHLSRWACPDCGTFLGFENKHCIECGTKINWSAIA